MLRVRVPSLIKYRYTFDDDIEFLTYGAVDISFCECFKKLLEALAMIGDCKNITRVPKILSHENRRKDD